MTWKSLTDFTGSLTFIKQKWICGQPIPEYIYGSTQEPHNHIGFDKMGSQLFHEMRRTDIISIFYNGSLFKLQFIGSRSPQSHRPAKP